MSLSSAGQNGEGSCSVTVTQVGTTTGDAVVGTFVASLKGDTSKDTGGPDHELAKGAFHLSLNVKIP